MREANNQDLSFPPQCNPLPTVTLHSPSCCTSSGKGGDLGSGKGGLAHALTTDGWAKQQVCHSLGRRVEIKAAHMY